MGLDNRRPISSLSAPLKSDTLGPLASVMLNSLPKFSELTCPVGCEEKRPRGHSCPSGHQPGTLRITSVARMLSCDTHVPEFTNFINRVQRAPFERLQSFDDEGVPVQMDSIKVCILAGHDLSGTKGRKDTSDCCG